MDYSKYSIAELRRMCARNTAEQARRAFEIMGPPWQGVMVDRDGNARLMPEK